MGGSGQSDVRSRPRTERSKNHMATEVRKSGQGLIGITTSQRLGFPMHKEQLGVSDICSGMVEEQRRRNFLYKGRCGDADLVFGVWGVGK